MLGAFEAAMVRHPLVAGSNTTVLSTVRQMHDHEHYHCAVIVDDEQQVLGILTERDVMSLVARQQPIDQLTLGQFLQQPGSRSARLTMPAAAWSDITAAIAYFEQQQATHLPVVDAQNRLIGVIQSELLRLLQNKNECDQATQALLELNQELESRVRDRTQELQEREQFLQTVLDTFPLSVFWKDVHSVYLGCNQHFLRDAGLQSINEIIGKTDYDLPWAATEADFYRADDRVVIETQTAKLGIVEPQHNSDGQTIWLETNKLPLCNLQGEVVGVMGTYQDITDRKSIELTLHDSEAKFRRITESVPGIIYRYILHPDGSDEFSYISPYVQQIFELTPAVVLQNCNTMWDRLHPEDVTEAQQAVQNSADSLQAFFIEARLLLADARVKWVQISAQPVCQNNGDIIWDGVVIDITDRKTMELALKASEQRYASLAAAAPVAIFRFDTPLHCVYVNERWSELSGRPMASALGYGWMESLHPEDREQSIAEWTEDYIQAHPDSQIIQGREGRHLRPDGTTNWCYIQVVQEFDDDGQVVGYIGTLTDITDRKLAEIELQSSQAQFRRLTENVPGIIYQFALHPDGRDSVTYISPQVADIYEVTAELVMQDSAYLWERIHPDDISIVQAQVFESAANLRPFNSEHRLATPSGLKFVKVNGKPHRQKDGTVFWDGVIIDITDRKLAEIALQDLSDRLEFALKSANIGIWEWQMPEQLLLWDDRMCALYGITPAEFFGKYEDWFQHVHPDDRNFVEQEQQAALEKTEARVEFRIIRPDGQVRFIDSYAFKQRDASGEIQKIIGLNIDITDRKNAELALQDLSARLEFALKGANIGIWEFQISDGQLLWDDRMYALYGILPEEFSGKYDDWLQRVHPDDCERAQQAEQESYQGAQEARVEFRIIRPDGTIRFIDSYAFNQWTKQGELQKTIGLNIDVTDHKQATALLRQRNEELARATRLKDEFLANMSHELRTPLNVILGMTEILQEQVFGDLNDRQLKSLQSIENSSNHLLELINDILDVAKIEAGQIELNYKSTNISTLCKSSVAFIKQQAFNKQIQLESVIPSDLPAISIDERRIRQVLINLLNNAVKFTPNGGKITIQVKNIPHQFQEGNAAQAVAASDDIEIAVIDTGIGIAADQIDRLFQPFVQVESALNRNYDGTGLGLALVKRLVELHGGRVELTSELGLGSCFTITLPVTIPDPLPATPEPPLSINSEEIRPDYSCNSVILLAEDNEASVAMVVNYLSLKGYRVVVAKNGQMAIDLAQQTHPALILMDIQMPGMDGLEAIRHLRHQPEFADTPIIALTALAMTGDRERCLAAGANDYCSKPVKLQKLAKQIDDYLHLN